MITRSNTSHGGWRYFLVPEGIMAVEVPQKKEISGRRKMGERKGVGCAIRLRRV